MNNLSTKLIFVSSLVVTIFGSTATLAQTSLQQQYEQDLKHCESATVVDKEACRKEAGAALQTAKKNELTSPANDNQSLTNRCQYQTGERQKECELLMQNNNAQVQGSVESGGVIRSMEFEYTPETPDSLEGLKQAPESESFSVN